MQDPEFLEKALKVDARFQVYPFAHTRDDVKELPSYDKYVLESYMVPEEELNKHYEKNQARLVAVQYLFNHIGG